MVVTAPMARDHGVGRAAWFDGDCAHGLRAQIVKKAATKSRQRACFSRALSLAWFRCVLQASSAVFFVVSAVDLSVVDHEANHRCINNTPLIPAAALHNTVFFCCELPMHLRLSSPGFGRWARGRYARDIFEHWVLWCAKRLCFYAFQVCAAR